MSISRQEQTLTYALPEEVGISSEKSNLLVNELELRVTQGELPGAVLMVVRNHKVVIHAPIGFRDRIEHSKMQKDSIFRIASMTKPIVSICALQLMEQGKLSLEDPVSKFLPEFANIQVGVETTNLSDEKELSLVSPNKKMTIQDLMRHTSGLTYGWVKTALVDQLYESNQVMLMDQTLEEQVKKLATLPLKHQPGTTWEYGLSTDVLGRVIEVIAEESLDHILQRYIFEPLQMIDTQFGFDSQKLHRVAESQFNPETGKRFLNLATSIKPKKLSGGGGLTSTAMDYAKFCQMILNGGELYGKKIISRKSIELMVANHLPDQTNFPASTLYEWGTAMPSPSHFGTGFGLGFQVRLEAGRNPLPGSVGDLTWMGVWGTSFVIDPKEKLILILLTQQPNKLKEHHRLLRQMVYSLLEN